MTDQPKDTTAEEPVAQALPVPATSAGSQPGGSGATSPDVQALLKRFDDLEKRLPDLVESKVKSTKDKRLAKMEKFIDDVESLRTSARDVVKDAASEGGFSPSNLGKVEDEDTNIKRALSAEHLKAAGIAPDDPEYLALVSEYDGKIKNPQHWDLVLRAHVDRRKGKVAKQDAPVAQAAVAAPTSPAPDKPDVVELTKRLTYLQDHDPLKNKAERKAIMEQLRKLTPRKEG